MYTWMREFFSSVTWDGLYVDSIRYWHELMLKVPDYIFQMLVSVLFLGLVVFFVWKGFRRGTVLSCRLILLELMFVLYCSTIIFRETGDVRNYDLHPFWSYEAIQGGKSELLAENIMNVIVFIPVGILIGLGFPRWSWRKTIGLGCLISISIEVLQFAFKRGFSEVDDVIHNTLGCAIGLGIAQLIIMVYSATVRHNK